MSLYRSQQDFIRENIKNTDVVLDVGFWGQGIPSTAPNWPHRVLKETARDIYGIDLAYDGSMGNHYRKGNAEEFDFSLRFDIIYAGELVEHLSNPGRFLQSCMRNMKPGGMLIVTTPNCFNFYNLVDKLFRREPLVNSDHTCYFNERTLQQLCAKNGCEVIHTDYIYSLGFGFAESPKKKLLNGIYRVLSFFTDKFVGTIAVRIVHASVATGREG
jgi:2-polyprenyl-3-methyl-5-hydroxy-6-metoxy-1,4-benzoquinol methylase